MISSIKNVNRGFQPVVVVLALMFLGAFVKCEYATSQSRERDPRLMYYPFLKVVVPPEPCGETVVNNVRSGVCLPKGKCNKIGTTGSTCSYGFGECCTISANCTAERTRADVTQYVTTLRQPVDSDGTTQCTFRIRKLPDVCQVRLDFQEYQSAPADANGDCVEDRLMISNSITVEDRFTTCGMLTGQHMYLSFGGSDSIDVTPVFATRKQYSIVATQIPCYSRRIVPSHCLQYFNKTTDVVKSFGYPQQQQNNQKYTICVEGTEQSRAVTWKPCEGTTPATAFYISTAPAGPDTCNRDFIQINGLNKMCGDSFPSSIMSQWKPYTLNVNFDSQEIPPFPSINPSTASDNTTCLAVATGSGGLLKDCIWDGMTCSCAFNGDPLLTENLFGVIDSNNTGFCLRYSV